MNPATNLIRETLAVIIIEIDELKHMHEITQMKGLAYYILFASLILASCSSVSKLSTYNIEVDNSIKQNELCKVMIFNNSHQVLYSQGTGIIDIRLDNDYYGKILIKDYIEFETNTGERNLVLEHWDLGYFTSKHEISLKKGINYIVLKAKPTSHRIEILDSISNDFIIQFKKRPTENNYKIFKE